MDDKENRKIAIFLGIIALSVLAVGLIGFFHDGGITGYQISGGSGGGEDSINLMTLHNEEVTALTNSPIKFGRAFIEGEVPQGFYPRVLIDGVFVQTQVDVKNRWDDGSLKFAVISFILPTINPDETKTITFENIDSSTYQSSVGTTGVSVSDMLNNFGFDAIIELTNPSAGTAQQVSARTMLQEGSISKVWIEGPVATTVVLADHSASRIYDLGWKQEGTRLTSSISASDTIISVQDVSWINVNDVLNLDDELVKVISIDTWNSKITVLRNQPGGLGAVSVGKDHYITSTQWENLNLPADDRYRSFRPIYIITFWPSINRVNVEFVGEISNTEALQDLDYDLSLKIGSSLQEVYSQAGIMQHVASRWMREFWQGESPGKIGIWHNKEYLAQTGLVDNYDSEVQVEESVVAGIYSDWLNANKNINDLGIWHTTRMGSGGARPELSQLPLWDVLWLFTADTRMQEVTRSQAEQAAAWPAHYREGDGSKVFGRDASTGALGTEPAIGKFVTQVGRPTANYVDLVSSSTSEEDKIDPVGRFTRGKKSSEDSDWEMSMGHLYNPFTISYILTGDFFAQEELRFWAGYGFLGHSSPRGPNAAQSGGIGSALTIFNGERYQAVPAGVRVYAAILAEDGTPEKEFLDLSMMDVIVTWMGMQNIPLADEPEISNTQWNQDMWTFGRLLYTAQGYAPSSYGSPPAPSPLYYWLPGSGDLCLGPAQPAGSSASSASKCGSPWMIMRLINIFGKLQDLGYPTANLLEFSSEYVRWHFTGSINPNDSNYVPSPFVLATYRQGTTDSNGDFYTTSQEVMNAFTASYLANPCPQVGGAACDSLPYDSNSYYSISLAALSRIYNQYPYAYNWWRAQAEQGGYTFGDTYNHDPRFALAPRVTGLPPNAPSNLQAVLNLN